MRWIYPLGLFNEGKSTWLLISPGSVWPPQRTGGLHQRHQRTLKELNVLCSRCSRLSSFSRCSIMRLLTAVAGGVEGWGEAFLSLCCPHHDPLFWWEVNTARWPSDVPQSSPLPGTSSGDTALHPDVTLCDKLTETQTPHIEQPAVSTHTYIPATTDSQGSLSMKFVYTPSPSHCCSLWKDCGSQSSPSLLLRWRIQHRRNMIGTRKTSPFMTTDSIMKDIGN